VVSAEAALRRAAKCAVLSAPEVGDLYKQERARRREVWEDNKRPAPPKDVSVHGKTAADALAAHAGVPAAQAPTSSA